MKSQMIAKSSLESQSSMNYMLIFHKKKKLLKNGWIESINSKIWIFLMKKTIRTKSNSIKIQWFYSKIIQNKFCKSMQTKIDNIYIITIFFD